jgi:hypothetical protein
MSAQKEVLHIRAEVKPQEERTAITPENAKKLIDSGRYALHVERSPERIYKDDEYQRTLLPPPATRRNRLLTWHDVVFV